MKDKNELVKFGENFDLRPYLDDMEYDKEVFISKVKHYGDMMFEGLIKAGEALICLKKMEGHGNYIDALQEIGISQQRASEMMAIAFCYKNKMIPNMSEEQLKKVEKLGKSKLILFSGLPEGIYKDFQNENLPGGIDLDEADNMPFLVLKEKFDNLKKQYQTGMKQNKILKEKLEKLDVGEEDDEMKYIKRVKDDIFSGLAEVQKKIKRIDGVKIKDMIKKEGDIIQSAFLPISSMIESIKFAWEDIKKNIEME